MLSSFHEELPSQIMKRCMLFCHGIQHSRLLLRTGSQGHLLPSYIPSFKLLVRSQLFNIKFINYSLAQ